MAIRRSQAPGTLVKVEVEVKGPTRELRSHHSVKDTAMLWTIAVVLLILWALGLFTSNSMGGLIHLLLVIAIVVVLIRVIQGRRVI